MSVICLNIEFFCFDVWDGSTGGEIGLTSLSADVGGVRHSHTFIQLVTNALLPLSAWAPCWSMVGVWRFLRGVGFHCLLLTCVRPQPCVCMCVHLCVSVVWWGAIFMFVWFWKAEKWNCCSPRDGTVLFPPTVTWNPQIERVPLHTRLSCRLTVSVLISYLFCSNSNSHLSFELMYYMLTVALTCCTWRKLSIHEECTAAQGAKPYGPYIWTVAFQNLRPIVTATLPTYYFSDVFNICCGWLMQTNPWHKDRPQ